MEREEVEAAMTRAMQEIQPQVIAMAHVMVMQHLNEGETLTTDEADIFEAGASAGMACALEVIAARGWLDPAALLREVA